MDIIDTIYLGIKYRHDITDIDIKYRHNRYNRYRYKI